CARDYHGSSPLDFW
nr:immunoglobulin heavy chain junction region [Mus musculus]